MSFKVLLVLQRNLLTKQDFWIWSKKKLDEFTLALKVKAVIILNYEICLNHRQYHFPPMVQDIVSYYLIHNLNGNLSALYLGRKTRTNQIYS